MPVTRKDRQQYRASIKDVISKFDQSLFDMRLMASQVEDGKDRLPSVYVGLSVTAVETALDSLEDALLDLSQDLADAESKGQNRPARGGP